MKLISVLFLAFLATSFANQALLKSLATMNKDPTGAAILSAISLNIKAKTPLGDVSDLLQAIRDRHLAESQDLESSSASAIQGLNDDIANDQAAIENLQNVISTLQDQIAASQTSLGDAESSLASTQQELEQTNSRISQAQADAAEKIPAFDQDISDLNAAIAAVNEAILKMGAYKQSSEGSASFIQMGTSVKDKLKKVTDQVQGMRKKLAKHSNMFTPLIRELIDLSANMNQSKADQVIDLLNQLLQTLSDALSNTENARAVYITNYQNEQETDAAAASAAAAQIDVLQQSISNLNDAIAQSQQLLEANQEILPLKQAQLASDQAALEAAQANYGQNRERLNNLLKLIKDAITYFNQNLAEVDDFVASVIDASL